MNKFRWLAVALAASLLINLVLVGFMAGRYSSAELRRPTFDPMLGMRGAAGFLSKERRAELKPQLRQFRSAAPSLKRLRGTQRTLLDAVTADPFERERLERALVDFRGDLGVSQQASHAAFVDLVESLTPQERKRLLRWMHKRLRHGPPDWRSPPPR